MQDATLPTRHGTHLDIDEPSAVQAIDEGLYRVEGPHTPPQVAIEPPPTGRQPAKRDDCQPADGGPQSFGPKAGPSNGVLLNDEHPAISEQIEESGEKFVAFGNNVSEQIRREDSMYGVIKSQPLMRSDELLSLTDLEPNTRRP